MKTLLLAGIAALFLATGTATAEDYSHIAKLLENLLDDGRTLKCGDIKVFTPAWVSG